VLSEEKPKRTRKKREKEPEAPELIPDDPKGEYEIGMPLTTPPAVAEMRLLDWHPNRPWKFILFTDLHVSAKTLDRALALLSYVRECAVANEAHVVCLGDFWDQRSTLNVRQLDAVQREFEQWGKAGVHLVMIPGNHDQVSLDGSVNAVRIFDAFDHIHVVNEPVYDPAAHVAFVPWREEGGAQQAVLNALPEGTTVFAHAEVQGASTNAGRAAAGRVSLAACNRMRAVYCGHYHQRQQLGSHTWYIGSPFEMSFAERDQPHGIALVTHDEIEPAFLDLDEFPKHYRLTWPEDKAGLAHPRAHDIVELVMPEADLGGPALREALKGVRSLDVRPVPAAKTDDAKAPALALTLDAALEEYVRSRVDDPMNEDAQADMVRLVALGRDILATVADARAIAPYAPHVRMTKVLIDDFCAIKGHVEIDLNKLGPVLLRGVMGAGKTSICDAITWALYGATTPRKPGATGAGLRADEVVHDDTNEARVRLCFECTPAEGTPVLVAVERQKVRGQGARVRIYGSHGLSEGMSAEEQQVLIHKLVGLDLDLWRACVYTGQGAVANFVTDADKRRKDLLARAFGLGACEPALKQVRDLLKRTAQDVATQKMRLAEADAGLSALASIDVRAEAQRWEEQRQSQLVALAATAQEATAHVEALKPHLAQEGQWLDAQRQYDAHVTMLAKSLVASTNDRAQKIAADLGAVQAERALVGREIEKSSAAYAKLISARDAGAPTCETCGQTLPVSSVDEHLALHEEAIAKARYTEANLAVRASNLATELSAAQSGNTTQKEAIRTQMDEARGHLSKINDALSTIARMKQASEEHARRASETQANLSRIEREVNPLHAQMHDAEARKATFTSAKLAASNALHEAEITAADLGVWEDGFSSKGLPTVVLRSALHELETHANAFLARLLAGKILCRLSLADDDLAVRFYEWDAADGKHHERAYTQLSGGQRRCVELAFAPFALSEMIFARIGVRVSFLVMDELTTHLDADTKPLVCSTLQTLDRETVLIIDHDPGVLGEFDHVVEVSRAADGTMTVKRGSA